MHAEVLNVEPSIMLALRVLTMVAGSFGSGALVSTGWGNYSVTPASVLVYPQTEFDVGPDRHKMYSLVQEQKVALVNSYGEKLVIVTVRRDCREPRGPYVGWYLHNLSYRPVVKSETKPAVGHWFRYCPSSRSPGTPMENYYAVLGNYRRFSELLLLG
jgi:hypothetical protein